MTGFDQLDAMIASLNTLGQLGEQAADDVAHVVEAALRRSIAAGTTPDGKPWEPTQEGKRPLQNAADAVFIAAVGRTVYVRLTGPEARHHLGRARGGIAREIIPTGDIPDSMIEPIRKVLGEHYQRHMGASHGS